MADDPQSVLVDWKIMFKFC